MSLKKNRYQKWFQNMGIGTENLSTEQMRTNTQSLQEGSESPPLSTQASEGTEGPVCTELGCLPQEAQSSGEESGRESDREMDGGGERGKERGSRWVSHLVNGGKARERKRERDLERCVLGWGVHKKYLCVCANGIGVSVLRLCGTFNVCSRAGQPRLRCQWTAL